MGGGSSELGTATTVVDDGDAAVPSDASFLRALAATPDDVALLPGELVGGQYRIERPLGAGGMGIVYLARDERLGRDVAIKVGSALAAGERARVEREAATLARLTHPNVVVVHQIGDHRGRTFFAMEHVDGGTARAWVAAEARGWRAIVALYAAAGDGLAAAHASGVVHRDFKPDNVLVGRDGRARVADFGIARPAADAEPTDAGVGTDTSRIAGTLAYMPPEQLRGDAVDARADQFAFCAALWEALYRARPFAGDTPDGLARAIAQGPSRPADTRGVPRRLERALRRGLAEDPGARWPSLPALLVALRRAIARIPRLAFAGVAATLTLAGVAVPIALRDGPAPCTDDAAALAPTWNAARAATIAGALDAAGGRGAWTTAGPRVDAYARAWVEAHHAACAATRLTGAASEAMLDRRASCLDGARAQLDAIARRLEAGGRDAAEHATQAVALLPDLAVCADVRALGEQALVPQDPTARAAVAAATAAIATARTDTLWVAKDAEATAARVRALADATRYPPVIADARLLEGHLLVQAGHSARGRAALEDTARYALANHLDVVAAEAYTALARHEAGDARASEARRWLDLASSLWTRIGEPTALGARLANAEATIAFDTGEPPAGLAAVQRQIARLRQVRGADPEDDYLLAQAQNQAGSPDKAARAIAAAIAEVERTGDTPRQIVFTTEAATIALESMHDARALDLGLRALALAEAYHGRDDVHLVEPLEVIGLAAAHLGDDARSRTALDRALALLAAHAPESEQVGIIEYELALQDGLAGRWPGAAAHARRALELEQHRLDPDSPLLAGRYLELGIAERELGHADASSTNLERALAISERGHGELDRETVNARVELSYTRLAQHREADAAALLAGVIERVDTAPEMIPAIAAEAHLAYADAAWRAGGDRARARAHATRARDAYAELGDEYAAQVRAAATWLAAHPP